MIDDIKTHLTFALLCKFTPCLAILATFLFRVSNLATPPPSGNDKIVDFRGQHYEYHFVALNEKTKNYPLTKPNTTYVITTEYIVSPVRTYVLMESL